MGQRWITKIVYQLCSCRVFIYSNCHKNKAREFIKNKQCNNGRYRFCNWGKIMTLIGLDDFPLTNVVSRHVFLLKIAIFSQQFTKRSFHLNLRFIPVFERSNLNADNVQVENFSHKYILRYNCADTSIWKKKFFFRSAVNCKQFILQKVQITKKIFLFIYANKL